MAGCQTKIRGISEIDAINGGMGRLSKTIFLVRHAVKEKAIGDISITSFGIKQAQSTARYLARWPIAAILSSPLRRASETADYIAQETKSTIRIDTRLRERANWGDLPGQSFQQFVEMWERCTRNPDWIPPIGDSARQAGERLSSLIMELVQSYPSGSHLVIVTHGGLLTDYLVHAFPEEELRRFHPQFITEQTGLVPECSITKLVYEREQCRIDTFASVEHLQDIAGSGTTNE